MKIHIPIYQNIFTYMYQVYRRYVFIWTGSKVDLEKHNIHQLNLNIKFRKKEFHFWRAKKTLKINYIPNYLERKQTAKPFLTLTESIQNRLKTANKYTFKYSQTLGIKRICPIKKDFDHHSRELKERFLKQGCDQKLVDEQLEKVDKPVRKILLQEKDLEQ